MNSLSVRVRLSAVPFIHTILNSNGNGRPLCGMLIARRYSNSVPIADGQHRIIVGSPVWKNLGTGLSLSQFKIFQ